MSPNVWRALGELVGVGRRKGGLKPRGVELRGRKWRVRIRYRGAWYHVGYFQTQAEAEAVSVRWQKTHIPDLR